MFGDMSLLGWLHLGQMTVLHHTRAKGEKENKLYVGTAWRGYGTAGALGPSQIHESKPSRGHPCRPLGKEAIDACRYIK